MVAPSSTINSEHLPDGRTVLKAVNAEAIGKNKTFNSGTFPRMAW
jgi:hypothetical protein